MARADTATMFGTDIRKLWQCLVNTSVWWLHGDDSDSVYKHILLNVQHRLIPLSRPNWSTPFFLSLSDLPLVPRFSRVFWDLVADVVDTRVFQTKFRIITLISCDWLQCNALLRDSVKVLKIGAFNAVNTPTTLFHFVRKTLPLLNLDWMHAGSLDPLKGLLLEI